MGTSISQTLDLSSNEYIQQFIGLETISPSHPFWNTFTSFNISAPTTTNDQLALESRLEPICQILLKNNPTSKNLSHLIQVFLIRVGELQAATVEKTNLFSWQVFNTLFTIRCILKFLTETVNEEQVVEHIEGDYNDAFESLTGALVGILVDVPVVDSSYQIHLEAVTTLLILLSTQYHSGHRSDHSIVYKTVIKGRHVIHAPVLIKCLLNNFIEQAKPPPGFGNQGHSLVLGFASELWSMLTFKTEEAESDYKSAPLATQSLLLILVLVHHWTTQSNCYRSSLFSCDNLDNTSTPMKTTTLFRVNYNSLYLTLCRKCSGDAPTLLLYLLLHQNQSFKAFLLSRTDLDQLVVPILKTLYNAPNSNSHHIYMSLIILLILSEDDGFNKMVHMTKLKSVLWYTERALSEISLGGLLILVVIRTVQYNMLKMRDKYLHTNCLAALANMSSQFRDLHPYVSQRLVSLFETIAKKYQKLVKKLEGNKREVAVTVSQDNEIEQDISVLEEVMRMVLEILNSCLTTQLVHNPNLIYTLLYNKHMFEAFKDNVVFQDIIHNIFIIIQYFSDMLSNKHQQNEVDAHQVLQVIQSCAKGWPKDKLTKFPDLKFKYVEEEQPEEFFIPYVWALVNQQSILHWNDPSQILTVC